MIKAKAKFLVLLLLISAGCRYGNVDSNVVTEPANKKAILISAADKNSAEPAIAADARGNIFVVYVEHEGKSADVFLRKLDQGANQFGEQIRVNPEEGKATSWFGDAPTIEIDDENNIYIGWTAKDPNAGKSNATILNLSVSKDFGKTFAPPVKVNDDTRPSSHGMHSLAVSKNKRVIVAWLDERNVKPQNHAGLSGGDIVVDPGLFLGSEAVRFTKIYDGEDHSNKATPSPTTETAETMPEMTEPNSEIFISVSNDGGKTFSKNQKVSGEVCPCCKTSLTIDNSGKIYVSWRQVLPGSFRHIAVASSEDGGSSFSNFVVVSDDRWEIYACPVSGAPMFVDNKNNLRIFWYTAGEAGTPGLYSSSSTDGGKTFGSRNLVYEGAVKGTLSVFSKSADEFGAFFDGMGEIFRVDQNLKSEENFEGELPAAVFTNGNIYVAFVKKATDKNDIWLRKY